MAGDNVGFAVDAVSGWKAIYLITRAPPVREFSSKELEALRQLEPIILEAISSHVGKIALLRKPSAAAVPGADAGHLEDRFAELFTDRLTSTQRLIVRMILRGHSSASIAANLAVSEGTIKVHRSNIYKRLSISSQSELFRMFIDHI